MSRDYAAEIQKLIQDKFKDNPDELKTETVKLERIKKTEQSKELTELLIAEMSKKSKGDIKIIKDLIKNGADITAKTEVCGSSVLHYASYFGDTEIIEECFEFDIFVDVVNKNKFTPLHWAIIGNSIESVKILLEKGASITRECKENTDALVLAKNLNRTEIIELLNGNS